MSGWMLYLRYISVAIRSAMAYRTSFVLTLLSRFQVALCGFFSVRFIFSGFEHIKGYTYADVLLCYAVIEISFSLAECIASGFTSFSSMIKRGGFDTVLLRPRSTIVQVLGTGFQFERLGGIASGLMMLAIGIGKHDLHWTPMRIATLLMMIAGGTLLFVSLFMAGAAICFFAVEESRALNLLTYGGRDHGKYPIDVYGKRLFQLCTYIVPYTLVQYYPLQFLTGRSGSRLLGLYPLGSILFLGACGMLWRFSVRRYTSTGS